ncbi:hypothetical protein [Methanosarcina lacustris]|uniref:hypothetical protein n=1 Tax=Methanosarcina lacustris TaxID=170861 RepID=UPI000AC851E3|nr:hypothetical protein [Methanosarcina lacustris]
MESKIVRFSTETKQGNTLSFSFNTETNLLIINLIEKSGAAENEFIWRYVDENALLEETLGIAQ